MEDWWRRKWRAGGVPWPTAEGESEREKWRLGTLAERQSIQRELTEPRGNNTVKRKTW